MSVDPELMPPTLKVVPAALSGPWIPTSSTPPKRPLHVVRPHKLNISYLINSKKLSSCRCPTFCRSRPHRMKLNSTSFLGTSSCCFRLLSQVAAGGSCSTSTREKKKKLNRFDYRFGAASHLPASHGYPSTARRRDRALTDFEAHPQPRPRHRSPDQERPSCQRPSRQGRAALHNPFRHPRNPRPSHPLPRRDYPAAVCHGARAQA